MLNTLACSLRSGCTFLDDLVGSSSSLVELVALGQSSGDSTVMAMKVMIKMMKVLLVMKAMRGGGGQFDEFARGRIIGLAEAGAKPNLITKKVAKTNRKHAKPDAVRKTIRKWKGMKGWRGERAEGSGRPQILTDKQKDKIADLVFEHRGSEVVTIGFLKNRLPSLRVVSDMPVSRGLHAAGLKWLRRDIKRLVFVRNRAPRIAYARWILRQPSGDTEGYAFVDGTTYYLALCDTQAENQRRERLGKFVWRDATGRDGLLTENVAPRYTRPSKGRQ